MFLLKLSFFCFFCSAFSYETSPKFHNKSVKKAKNYSTLEESKGLSVSEEAVHVDVHFESYCPDSIDFVTNQLYPTWQKLKDDEVFTFTLYPYGKAHSYKLSNGSYFFRCQHGADECEVNIIENCIIAKSNNVADVYLPIINCIEEKRRHKAVVQECVEKSSLSWSNVEQCSYGEEGNQLMFATGEKTNNLQPEMTWVPWIVVNNEHTDAIQQAATKDLLQLICDTYAGSKPSGCSQKTKENLNFEEEYKFSVELN